jgi:IS30 family transposase
VNFILAPPFQPLKLLRLARKSGYHNQWQVSKTWSRYYLPITSLGNRITTINNRQSTGEWRLSKILIFKNGSVGDKTFSSKEEIFPEIPLALF